MKRCATILMMLIVSGCASGGGARWYAPATWFSDVPANRVDAAASKEDKARDDVIRQAQRTAHQTGIAIAAAKPESRAISTAGEFANSTVALLDQAAGPIQSADLARLRATVTGLLSENAETRASAERQRATEQRNIDEVSAKLAKAESASDAANAKLRKAFERENELANELRAQRALVWISCGIAVLLAIAWLYVRFAIGGIPTALGRGLAVLRQKNPEAADLATQIFDSYLNRHEQQRISKEATL